MNLPNKLTLLRIILIPFFMGVLYWGFPGADYVALLIFIIASLTDLLDGQIARKYNQVTDFGKFMDPLADKCLVVAAMLWFVEGHGMLQMPAWALLIVIVREFAVSGLRMQAAASGKVIAAGQSGKIKTASTMVCICLMLILPEFAAISFFANWGGLVFDVCVWIIVATTVYSGAEYLIVNRKVFSAMK